MIMHKKRLLILKTSSDVCAAETSHIKAIADLIELECEQLEIKSDADVYSWIPQNGSFDYIYLCGHANEKGFGEASGSNLITWPSFATALSTVNWLNKDGVLFLATCRGGLRQIADNMFNICGKIDYICGPRCWATGHDLTTAFHIFIYNLEVRGEEPAVAVERASAGTGRHFFCYDRLDCFTPEQDDILSFIKYLVKEGDLDLKELNNLVAETIHNKSVFAAKSSS